MSDEETMTEEQKLARAEELKGEIQERFMALAETWGPEDTLYYAQTIVSQMREELAALGDDGENEGASTG